MIHLNDHLKEYLILKAEYSLLEQSLYSEVTQLDDHLRGAKGVHITAKFLGQDDSP